MMPDHSRSFARRDHSTTSAPQTTGDLDELVEEFVGQLREGQHPSITGYTRRYPHLTDEIRELFPTIAAMEGLHLRSQQNARIAPPLDLQELGDFRIVGEIGRGGMGVVYEAEQVTLGRRVAVKVLPKAALNSPHAIQRFRREAQTAAKLHHTNIVPVFGVGEQEGNHYIVMQLIQGVGLDEVMLALRDITLPQTDSSKADTADLRDSTRRLGAQRRASGMLTHDIRSSADPVVANPQEKFRDDRDKPSEPTRMPTTVQNRSERELLIASPASADIGQPAQPELAPARPRLMGAEYWRNVARIGVQAARALGYAHSHGTLHRDLKPANLLLDDRGVVWMADFGLAKAVEDDQVTWTGDIVGTLCYLAPERFEGVEDARSDIYSLGLTLYELLTLEKAFSAKDRASLLRSVTEHPLTPPRQLDRRIPRDLETIVLKAAARDPKDRYFSADELVNDLEAFLNGRPISARRLTPFEQGWRWCRRNPMVASMGLLVLGAITVSVLGISHACMGEAAEHRRAEVTGQLALQAFDGIYNQLAPDVIQPPPDEAQDAGDSELEHFSQSVPVSRNVAVVLTSLLDFYDQLSAQAANNSEILVKSVTAKRKVGDIQLRLDESEKGLAAYEDSLDLWKSAPHFADNPQMLLELGRIHNGIGMAHDSLERHAKALPSFEAAIEILSEVESPDPATRYELAKSHLLHHVAQVKARRSQQPASALSSDHLTQAESILRQLRADFPGVPEYQLLMAKCYRANRLNDLSHHECLPCAIEILRELVAKYPESPDYRFELGSASNDLIRYQLRQIERNIMEQKGGTAETEELAALRSLEQEIQSTLDVIRIIEQDYPTVVQYLILSTQLHAQYARVLRSTGQLSAAIQEMNTVVAKQRQVVRQAHRTDRSEGSIHELWLHKFQLSLAKLRHLAEPHRAYEIQAEMLNVRNSLVSLQEDPGSSLSSGQRRLADHVLHDIDELIESLLHKSL